MDRRQFTQALAASAFAATSPALPGLAMSIVRVRQRVWGSRSLSP